MAWNAEQYQAGYSFVWQYGRDLLGLLAPQPGERILDAGCGTGQLTAEIAASGAEVTGIDSSAAMIEQARRNAPTVRFEVGDIRHLPYRAEFDAVFSNAVLHWVPEADEAAESFARALKPGGRVVIEMGGRGNVRDCSPRPIGHCANWAFPTRSVTIRGSTLALPNTPPSWSATAWKSPSPPSSIAPRRCRTASGPGLRCSARS